MDIFWGVMPFLNYFFGVIYNSMYFWGFCTFLGKSLYFYKSLCVDLCLIAKTSSGLFH